MCTVYRRVTAVARAHGPSLLHICVFGLLFYSGPCLQLLVGLPWFAWNAHRDRLADIQHMHVWAVSTPAGALFPVAEPQEALQVRLFVATVSLMIRQLALLLSQLQCCAVPADQSNWDLGNLLLVAAST